MMRSISVPPTASRQSGTPGPSRSTTQQVSLTIPPAAAALARHHVLVTLSARRARLDGDQGERPGVGGQQACQRDSCIGDLVAHAPAHAQQRGPLVRAPHQLRVAAPRAASVQSSGLVHAQQHWPLPLMHGTEQRRTLI